MPLSPPTPHPSIGKAILSVLRPIIGQYAFVTADTTPVCREGHTVGSQTNYRPICLCHHRHRKRLYGRPYGRFSDQLSANMPLSPPTPHPSIRKAILSALRPIIGQYAFVTADTAPVCTEGHTVGSQTNYRPICLCHHRHRTRLYGRPYCRVSDQLSANMPLSPPTPHPSIRKAILSVLRPIIGQYAFVTIDTAPVYTEDHTVGSQTNYRSICLCHHRHRTRLYGRPYCRISDQLSANMPLSPPTPHPSIGRAILSYLRPIIGQYAFVTADTAPVCTEGHTVGSQTNYRPICLCHRRHRTRLYGRPYGRISDQLSANMPLSPPTPHPSIRKVILSDLRPIIGQYAFVTADTAPVCTEGHTVGSQTNYRPICLCHRRHRTRLYGRPYGWISDQLSANMPLSPPTPHPSIRKAILSDLRPIIGQYAFVTADTAPVYTEGHTVGSQTNYRPICLSHHRHRTRLYRRPYCRISDQLSANMPLSPPTPHPSIRKAILSDLRPIIGQYAFVTADTASVCTEGHTVGSQTNYRPICLCHRRHRTRLYGRPYCRISDQLSANMPLSPPTPHPSVRKAILSDLRPIIGQYAFVTADTAPVCTEGHTVGPQTNYRPICLCHHRHRTRLYGRPYCRTSDQLSANMPLSPPTPHPSIRKAILSDLRPIIGQYAFVTIDTAPVYTEGHTVGSQTNYRPICLCRRRQRTRLYGRPYCRISDQLSAGLAICERGDSTKPCFLTGPK